MLHFNCLPLSAIQRVPMNTKMTEFDFVFPGSKLKRLKQDKKIQLKTRTIRSLFFTLQNYSLWGNFGAFYKVIWSVSEESFDNDKMIENEK